jgi:Ni/Co efflux regulator RcnB
MRKLTLIGLAAGAALLSTTAAMAQPRGHGQAGHSWSSSRSHSSSNVMVRHRGGGFGHPGRNFRHQRLQRGFFIHPFWFGPQFHVQNWQMYGFTAPPRDHRWVRHYNDAYMIDREGRVRDHRYDMDWDEYGERWEMDDGIPSYYGENDWRPDEDDYAWVEGQGPEDEDYADRGHGYPMRPGNCGAPDPCGGHGGYGYYGYGVAYPAIIIETTVTTGGTVCCEEVVEEVVEVQRPRRRHRRVIRQRPRPPAGERG